MLHTRLYIIQLFGLLLLICGYLLSDPPDSLSVMHIDPNPACPSVFSKASLSPDKNATKQTISSSQDNHSRKTNAPKYISFETILTVYHSYQYYPVNLASYSCPLPYGYNYLYSGEINPPPPKAC